METSKLVYKPHSHPLTIVTILTRIIIHSYWSYFLPMEPVIFATDLHLLFGQTVPRIKDSGALAGPQVTRRTKLGRTKTCDIDRLGIYSGDIYKYIYRCRYRYRYRYRDKYVHVYIYRDVKLGWSTPWQLGFLKIALLPPVFFWYDKQPPVRLEKLVETGTIGSIATSMYLQIILSKPLKYGPSAWHHDS